MRPRPLKGRCGWNCRRRLHRSQRNRRVPPDDGTVARPPAGNDRAGNGNQGTGDVLAAEGAWAPAGRARAKGRSGVGDVRSDDRSAGQPVPAGDRGRGRQPAAQAGDVQSGDERGDGAGAADCSRRRSPRHRRSSLECHLRRATNCHGREGPCGPRTHRKVGVSVGGIPS